MKKKTISITLDGDVLEQARALSKQEDRSFSRYVNQVLKAYLKAQATPKAPRNNDL